MKIEFKVVLIIYMYTKNNILVTKTRNTGKFSSITMNAFELYARSTQTNHCQLRCKGFNEIKT